MIYQWSELENVFITLGLDIYDVDLHLEEDCNYRLNGKIIRGAKGKTCWYIPLEEDELQKFGLVGNCGLKIIKYPVNSDILDEHRRLLQEFSIQKILHKKNMAPDIYKLLLIRNRCENAVEWLSKEMKYPANSVFFAQIVEHIDSFQEHDTRINTNDQGYLYGKLVDDFLEECRKLRIQPYDVNMENICIVKGQMKVIDVHKWRRTYTMQHVSAPKYIQIELNNSCNAHCKMCNIPNMTRKKGMMSDELFLKIVKEANDLGVQYITPFLHGEPFLRKDFVDKLRLINEFAPKARITIFTNASLLTDEIIYELRDIKNIEQLVFSFPGGNKEIYECVTGLNFELTVKNIKKAFEVLDGFNVRISMPKFEGNKSSEWDFFELWKNYPCSTYETYNYLADVKDTLSEDCYEQCDRAFRSMTILFDGRVCLCCMDSDGKHIMGDVYRDHMVDVWNNSNYMELRLLHGSCRIAYTPCDRCTLDLRTEEYNNAYNFVGM